MTCRLALDMELISCQGKTPDATMASALYTDVKRKLHLSVFTRPQVYLPTRSPSHPGFFSGHSHFPMVQTLSDVTMVQ